MNDDPGQGASADSRGSSSRRAERSSTRRQNGGHRRRRSSRQPTQQQGEQPDRRHAIPPERASIVMRKVRAGLIKKLQFFTDLMKQLDMIVFAELCTLYYMDCSFFRFILRAMPQTFFLSPKADDFLLVTPAHKPHVFAVFIPNALCLLLHAFAALPRASEAARGYLHGGVMIDFVGQSAPSSRWGLLLLDVLVLAVQCLMLAVHTEREKLRQMVAPMRGSSATAQLASAAANTLASATAAAAGNGAAAAAPSLEDHDAEERAVLRRPPRNMAAAEEGSNGIELQAMSSSERARGAAAEPDGGAAEAENNEDGEERDAVDGRPRRLPPEEAADNVLEALSSGCNLSDFYVIHAIRNASRDYQGAAAQSLQTLGYAVTLARLAAERSARAGAGPRPQ